MSRQHYVVVGLGLTGLSCIDFLVEKGLSVIAMDTRETPPNLTNCRAKYPHLDFYTAEWPQTLLNEACAIVVSPGVSILHPALIEAKKAGTEIIGDVELFARFNKVPIIAITGSNGKSTVTTLVGEMAVSAGKQTAVIGNIGTPVLNVLAPTVAHDLAVMELSSFQLETTVSLKPLVATVLNITPDHMDRYATFKDYVAAKHRIFHSSEQRVVNKQDPYSDLVSLPCDRKWFFTLDEPKVDEFGLRYKDEKLWLAHGKEYWLPITELKILGKHNVANALASLALGMAVGLEKEAMLGALRRFGGLPHRCQWVAEQNQIRWINDSKGTNIGACQAALIGLGEPCLGKVVLILGGEGKGANFKELIPVVARYCRALIVKGKDANQILADLEKIVPSFYVSDMQEAVHKAADCAKPNDIVLLSPACASLDQYRDYAHRGDIFMDVVKRKFGSHASFS